MEKEDMPSKMKPCPHVKDPISDECYNVKLDSQSIINVLKYCAKDFTACDVYRSHYPERSN